MNFLKSYGYAIYLGTTSGALGFGLFTWQFWAINVPTILLVLWKCKGVTK